MEPVNPPRIDLLLEPGGGGSGRHVLDLYSGLRTRNWDARLILSAVRMEKTFAEEVAELPAEHVTLLNLRRSPHFSDVSAVQRLRNRFGRIHGTHILHAHSTKAGMIGWALRNSPIKRVLTPHAYRGMDPVLTGVRRSVVRRAERMFSLPFDAIIAVSETEKTYARALGINAKKIYTISNGVDAEKIATLTTAKTSQGRGDKYVVGFVGRLTHQKNPLLFIQVFSQLLARGLPVRARVIGDGPLRSHLQEFASQLKIEDHIEWCGTVRAVEEMATLDVLVHTSHYESSPYALLEAAAANVPVVAVPNAGSCSLFEEHLSDALVDSMGAVELASRVEAVLLNSALRQHYTKQYSHITAVHSVDRMVDQTIAVYTDVLTHHANVRHARMAPTKVSREMMATKKPMLR